VVGARRRFFPRQSLHRTTTHLLAVFVVFLSQAIDTPRAAAALREQPNIVFILADDLDQN
jgi:hypothetical protein